MSTEDETKALPAPFDTVSKAVGMHPDSEMNAIGLAIGAIMLVVILPALPFILAAWLLGRLRTFLRRQTSGEEVERATGAERPPVV
jgi:hypothetical protein